ncbi:5605_t:CDS:2, partial [Racocetra fulgida]
TDSSEDDLLFDYNRVEQLEKANRLGSEENEIDKNEYINYLVESQKINIVGNNLENIRLSEDNEGDSDLK